MITIIYSTHKDETYNNKFKQHLLQTVGLKNVQILEYTNYNQYSLTEVYNKNLNESVNDIIVFCHNDIIFEKEYQNLFLCISTTKVTELCQQMPTATDKICIIK